MKRVSFWIVAVAVALVYGGSDVDAQFYDIALQKSAFYRQSGTEPPVSRAVDASLLLPPGELIGPQGPIAMEPFAGSTREHVDQYLPEGSYRFKPTDGTATDIEIHFEFGPNWWPEVPTFTRASMDKIEALVDPTQGLVLEWQPFIPAATAPQPRISIYLDDEDSSLIFDRSVPTSLDRLVLPAGTLKPANTYTLNVWFTNSLEGLETDGTLTVFRTLDVSSATTITFQTVPEPASSSALLIGLMLPMFRALSRRRQQS